MQKDNEIGDVKNVSPLGTEDYPSSKALPETPQSRSASFIPAYADPDFLLRDELRPVRFQLELLKPELLQEEQGIDSTVVVLAARAYLYLNKPRKI